MMDGKHDVYNIMFKMFDIDILICFTYIVDVLQSVVHSSMFGVGGMIFALTT